MVTILLQQADVHITIRHVTAHGSGQQRILHLLWIYVYRSSEEGR